MRGILCTGSEKILLSLFVLVSDLWQVLHCSWLPIGVGTYNMRVSSLLTIKRSTELPYYLGIFLIYIPSIFSLLFMVPPYNLDSVPITW